MEPRAVPRGRTDMRKTLEHVSFRSVVMVVALLCGLTNIASSEPRLVTISRRLAIDCSGDASRTPTVVLIAGGGRDSKDWSQVQPAVAQFTRVCSYDEAGFGGSDKVDHFQSSDEVVDDLHALLVASGEKAPYIVVGHSLSGIYARKFETQFPKEVAGLVFVDSAHEEQAWRLYDVKPMEGALNERTALLGWFIQHGQRLAWHTQVPLIVVARGKPLPRDRARELTDEQFATWERTWQDLQADLASRSANGELRHAEKSGHMINFDQPEAIIQAIRDVRDCVIERHSPPQQGR